MEIVGEAVKKLPREFCDRHPEAPWPQIAGMRDVLIHDYFGVNLQRVSLVVEQRVPELKRQVDSWLLQEIGENSSRHGTT